MMSIHKTLVSSTLYYARIFSNISNEVLLCLCEPKNTVKSPILHQYNTLRSLLQESTSSDCGVFWYKSREAEQRKLHQAKRILYRSVFQLYHLLRSGAPHRHENQADFR